MKKLLRILHRVWTSPAFTGGLLALWALDIAARCVFHMGVPGWMYVFAGYLAGDLLRGFQRQHGEAKLYFKADAATIAETREFMTRIQAKIEAEEARIAALPPVETP